MPQSEEAVVKQCQKWLDGGTMARHLIISDGKRKRLLMEHAKAIFNYVVEHFQGHITVENLDKAASILLRSGRLPEPSKPQVSEE